MKHVREDKVVKARREAALGGTGGHSCNLACIPLVTGQQRRWRGVISIPPPAQ